MTVTNVGIDVRFLLIAFWASTLIISFGLGVVGGIIYERGRK